MDASPNFPGRTKERFTIPQTDGRYFLEFDRREAMPPDEVSAIEGLVAGHTLQLIELATKLYGLEARRGWRVLDLGCGVGTFLVGAIAGAAALSLEVVGVDNDPKTLDYAETNVARATAIALVDCPGRQLGRTVVYGDWDAPDIWQRLGYFDYIFLNPPYLKPGEQIKERGYEEVPLSQIYNDNPPNIYERLWRPCFDHLKPGGVLAVRGSSRQFGQLHTGQPLEGLNAQIELIAQHQTYSEDRSGYVERFAKLPLDWPTNRLSPYADPRLRILLSTGKDIGAAHS